MNEPIQKTTDSLRCYIYQYPAWYKAHLYDIKQGDFFKLDDGIGAIVFLATGDAEEVDGEWKVPAQYYQTKGFH